jgi:hypothetical protein
MKFNIKLLNTGILQIHKYGCADLKFDRQQNVWEIESTSVNEAIEKQLKAFEDDGMIGYSKESFRIMPCIK